MDDLWMIVGMTAVTFGARYPLLTLIGRFDLPPRVAQALRFVPPAVLSAIILPALLTPDGVLAISFENEALIAGIAAGLIAWRVRRTLLTIVVGMTIYLLLRTLRG